MKQEKVIMYDSPEAAKQATVTGWVTSDGKFSKDEHMARYAGCTHKSCECGQIMPKHYLKCQECRDKLADERFNNLPEKEWDGKEFVCIYNSDKFFSDEESFLDWCEDNEEVPEEVQLMFCIPQYAREVDIDLWSDIFPENVEDEKDIFSKEFFEKLADLNNVIKKHPPLSYTEGNIKAIYKNKENATT